MNTLIIAVLVLLVVLELVGLVTKHPLALWVAEVIVMGAVFALVKSVFGTKGYVRGYTGRPRFRR
jgi:hypothetical protein